MYLYGLRSLCDVSICSKQFGPLYGFNCSIGMKKCGWSFAVYRYRITSPKHLIYLYSEQYVRSVHCFMVHELGIILKDRLFRVYSCKHQCSQLKFKFSCGCIKMKNYVIRCVMDIIIKGKFGWCCCSEKGPNVCFSRFQIF